MVCYLAPFTQTVRRKLYKRWLAKVQDGGIRLTPNMNFNQTFTDALLIKSWLSNGLPNDSYSIENAVILELSLSSCRSDCCCSFSNLNLDART